MKKLLLTIAMLGLFSCGVYALGLRALSPVNNECSNNTANTQYNFDTISLSVDDIYNSMSTFETISNNLSGYVPYTGANSNVNLGNHTITTSGTLGAFNGARANITTGNISLLNVANSAQITNESVYGYLTLNGANVVTDSTLSTFELKANKDIANGYAGLDSNGKVITSETYGASVSAGGSDTQVQFNTSGALGGNSHFTWNDTIPWLKVSSESNSAIPTATFTRTSNGSFNYATKSISNGVGSGVNIGLWGLASGGGTNYGGYIDPILYVTGTTHSATFDVSNNIHFVDNTYQSTAGVLYSDLSTFETTSHASSTYATLNQLNTFETIMSFNSAIATFDTVTARNTALSTFDTKALRNTVLATFDTIALRNTTLSTFELSSHASSTYAPLASPTLTGTVVTTGSVSVEGDLYTNYWTNYSNTSTIVGGDGTYDTKLIYYKKVGRLVFVSYNISITAAHSVGTSFTFTVPVATAAGVNFSHPCYTVSNVTEAYGRSSLPASSSTVTFTAGIAGTWVNGLSKTAIGEFWYEAAN